MVDSSVGVSLLAHLSAIPDTHISRCIRTVNAPENFGCNATHRSELTPWQERGKSKIESKRLYPIRELSCLKTLLGM